MPTGKQVNFVKVGSVNDFGMKVVGGPVKNSYGTLYWEAICPSCNKQYSIRTNRFFQTRYCKDCSDESRKSITETSRWNTIYAAVRCRKVSRELGFDLSLEDFIKISKMNCHYCGAAPQKRSWKNDWHPDIYYNGLDRVDSARGYVYDNVVACCIRCNMAKSDGTFEEMLNWAKTLVERW
jgi:hypothetical protein